MWAATRAVARARRARRRARPAVRGRAVLDRARHADAHLRPARALDRSPARPRRTVLAVPRLVLRRLRVHGGDPPGALRRAHGARRAGGRRRRDPARAASSGSRCERAACTSSSITHRPRLRGLGRGAPLVVVHRRRQRRHQRAVSRARAARDRLAHAVLLPRAPRRDRVCALGYRVLVALALRAGPARHQGRARRA